VSNLCCGLGLVGWSRVALSEHGLVTDLSQVSARINARGCRRYVARPTQTFRAGSERKPCMLCSGSSHSYPKQRVEVYGDVASERQPRQQTIGRALWVIRRPAKISSSFSVIGLRVMVVRGICWGASTFGSCVARALLASSGRHTRTRSPVRFSQEEDTGPLDSPDPTKTTHLRLLICQ